MPKLAIITLTDADGEAQIGIRHPDGQVIVLTLKAHRNALTAYIPRPVVVRERKDSGEVEVSCPTGESGT